MTNTKEEPAQGKKVLFSANTYLGYVIAEHFYNHIHYAWFTTRFDFGTSQPASSNPRAICNEILNAVASNDHHCEKINRIGEKILVGAYSKRKEKTIDEEQEKTIRALVERSKKELYLMMPVIYVASWDVIKDYCEIVDEKNKASTTSIEYLCRELPRHLFDIIELQELLNDVDCFRRRLI